MDILSQHKFLDMLPPPFAWIYIPEGKVVLLENRYDGSYVEKGVAKTFDVPAFAIAKYPVTNAQYTKFIEAGGYQQQKWWRDDGWQLKPPDGTAPRCSKVDTLLRSDHPVVGISWYEACAFCSWLSEASGEKIMLPTEQQWQRAAQGEDRRAYPWGNEWDDTRCNNSVHHKSTSTTPINQYDGKGDSPFAVSDMSGNVCEWCLTDYETGENELSKINAPVLRGGSWLDTDLTWLRVDFRGANHPNDWEDDWGFRCVLKLNL